MKQRKFGLVDADIIQDSELSLRAKAIYALLSTYAGTDRSCYPSVATICNRAGVSRRTMERILKELELKNYVRRNHKTFVLIDGLKKEEEKIRIPRQV
jgi:DNA-binding MarR family transcriptional regulator